MPPNPETLEESDENVQSRRPTSLLNSVHLVRMADNEMTSRTPSPSSSRSSPVSLLRVTPYQKEVPDWESPGLRVRVTDIVKQFEDINKRGKEYDDRYRNESRSSGIVSDFDEDHDLNWSNSTFSRSSTPRSSQEREEVRQDDRHVESFDATPLRRPTPRSSVNSTPDDDDEPVAKVSDPEDDDEPVAKVCYPEDDGAAVDEVEYGVELNNNSYDENNYDEPSLIVRLVKKLFTFSVLLFLLGSGGYGGLLLRQKLDDAFNLDQDEVSGSFPTPFLPVKIVGAITLKFLGWYFIFRNSFKCLESSSFFVGNGLLAVFQPALYFISGWLSKSENAIDSSPSSDPYSPNYDPYSASVSESEEKEDIDDEDSNPAEFSFDAAIPEESDATENEQKTNTGTVLLITAWLSLLQIALVITPSHFYPELEDMSSLESFLIFGQLPQLIIYLVTYPVFTFKGGNRAKIE